MRNEIVFGDGIKEFLDGNLKSKEKDIKKVNTYFDESGSLRYKQVDDNELSSTTSITDIKFESTIYTSDLIKEDETKIIDTARNVAYCLVCATVAMAVLLLIGLLL